MCQVENNKSLISISKLFFSHLLSAIENRFYIIDCQPLHFECDNKWLNVQQHNKFLPTRARSSIHSFIRSIVLFFLFNQVNEEIRKLSKISVDRISSMLKHERFVNWFIILHPFICLPPISPVVFSFTHSFFAPVYFSNDWFFLRLRWQSKRPNAFDGEENNHKGE